MISFKLNFLGKENLVRGFEGLVRYAGDVSPIFKEIHADFLKMEEKNFDSQGYPEKFQALSSVYRLRKMKKAPGQPIMQLSGDLKRAATNKGPGHIFERVGPGKYKMGMSTPYAHRHQVGYEMPQRKIIQIPSEKRKEWAYFIQRFLVKGVKEHLKNG